MSSLTTFDRFSSLPREIQIEIWRYAGVMGLISLAENLLLSLSPHLRDGSLHIEDAFLHYISTRDPGWISSYKISDPDIITRHDLEELLASRTALLSTCLTSRQIVWEILREEVQGISIKGIYSSTYGDQGVRVHQGLVARLSELDKKRKYKIGQTLLVALDRIVDEYTTA